jgi:hypothetical protein
MGGVVLWRWPGGWLYRQYSYSHPHTIFNLPKNFYGIFFVTYSVNKTHCAMKTQKINLFNVGFSGFSATEADLRDGTVGHVNYALSQIDLGTGADTDYNARGRVLFNVYTAIGSTGYGPGNTLNIGEKYIIDSFSEGDDFTNVGAAENAQGVVFTATGDTPAVWNGSTLIQNAASSIAEIFAKLGEQKNYKWIMLGDEFLSFNKGFEVIGGPAEFTEFTTQFDYVVTDEQTVLDNVEYFYGRLVLALFDVKVYDSTFQNLTFEGYFADEREGSAYLVLQDPSVDFRNYTVWSSPLVGVYRSLNTGDIKYPIGSTGRATAISDAAYLSEFVDSEDGKIYIPIFEAKLGLRFDFEIRLYDYVAPTPAIDVDEPAEEAKAKDLT